MAEEKHALEGKYIVFKYMEQDRESEGQALALFRLKNSKLEEVFHPGLVFDPANLHEAKEPLLRLMQKRKIKEVVSVFYGDEFFGIPSGWESLDEESSKNKEVQQWLEYQSVCIDDDEVSELREAGINVLFYDETKGKFLP